MYCVPLVFVTCVLVLQSRVPNKEYKALGQLQMAKSLTSGWPFYINLWMYRIYPYKTRSHKHLAPNTGVQHSKLNNARVKCRKDSYKCWVKNHLQEINTQIQINTVLKKSKYFYMLTKMANCRQLENGQLSIVIFDSAKAYRQ